MNRRARDNRPYVLPVQKIEVSQKNIKLRWAAAILFFVVGAATLAFSLNASLSQDPGWQEIKIDSSYTDSCAGEFVLMYNVGGSGTPATKEYKALKAHYAEATEEAYQIFHCSTEYEGISNICSINMHPNEAVTVDPALYRAFALLEQYGIRHHYLGPAYEVYNGIFSCQEDVHALDYDPCRNETVRDFFAQVARYAADPNAVQLELLEANQVRLVVSEDYLAFAQENDTCCFLDLYWMRNAFAADFLADRLTELGYTQGILSSFDGFVRNLDDSGTDFFYQLYGMTDRTVLPAAVMRYDGPASLVLLKGYPVTDQDLKFCYLYDDGDIRRPYLDTADGLPKAANQELLAYSSGLGCAEILLRILPEFVTDQFQEEALLSLTEEGIGSVYSRENVICYTEETLELTDLYQSDLVSYRAELVK